MCIRDSIFSLGIILYTMLTSTSPFYATTYDDVVRKNLRGHVDFEFKNHKKVPSTDAVDLLRRMVELDPRKRPTALEALQHNWVLAPPITDSPAMRPILSASEHMKMFQDMERFNMMKIKSKAASGTSNGVMTPGTRDTSQEWQVKPNGAKPDEKDGRVGELKERLARIQKIVGEQPKSNSPPKGKADDVVRTRAKLINANLRNFEAQTRQAPLPMRQIIEEEKESESHITSK
eukprot:TRINITY_DN524_c0_g1_i3.p1 TRINITY_DN524_c0_g1~~TRINITY_DN524_c0_g1_i3.p1  ORF type:complete len:233 (-),score=53.20 TRINITY_DN524_c0_g1_i3:136-834(-)